VELVFKLLNVLCTAYNNEVPHFRNEPIFCQPIILMFFFQ